MWWEVKFTNKARWRQYVRLVWLKKTKPAKRRMGMLYKLLEEDRLNLGDLCSLKEGSKAINGESHNLEINIQMQFG